MGFGAKKDKSAQWAADQAKADAAAADAAARSAVSDDESLRRQGRLNPLLYTGSQGAQGAANVGKAMLLGQTALGM